MSEIIKKITKPIDSLPKTFLVGDLDIKNDDSTFQIKELPNITICMEQSYYHMLMYNIDDNTYFSIYKISELNNQFKLFDENLDRNQYIWFEYNSDNKTISVHLPSVEELAIVKYIKNTKDKIIPSGNFTSDGSIRF